MAIYRSKFGPSSDRKIAKIKIEIVKLKLDQKRMIEWACQVFHRAQENWKTEKSLILDEFDKRMQADHSIDQAKQEEQKPVPKISRKAARKARREAADAEASAGQAKDMKQNKTKAKKTKKPENARKDDNFEK